MEVKGSTIAAAIAGSFFISLIILFMLWKGWKESIQIEKTQIEDHVERLEYYWRRQGQRVEFQYDDVLREGFPFETRLRLIKPRIRAVVGNGIILLGANKMDIVADDSDNEPATQYKIDMMQDGYLRYETGGRKADYFLYLSQKPELFLRKAPSQQGGPLPATFNLYGYILPPQLRLTVTQNNQSKVIPINNMQQQQPMWRPMVSRPRDAVVSLLSMLQRSMQGL